MGTLEARPPGGQRFIYPFTREDLFWTAKLIVLEAGGADDANNAAVIWAMFNRYALFTHSRYPTFTAFVRAYSTTLQPVLSNARAAARHMNSPDFLRTGDYYPGTTIPRGQLARHCRIQAAPWKAIEPASARSLAYRALTGGVPDPGIGNATEFASTRILWQRANRTRRNPGVEEWTRYTKQFAAHRNLRWIGEVSGIDQMKNAFFLHPKAAQLPPGVVRVLAPRGAHQEL